jgi:hypothetical protein
MINKVNMFFSELFMDSYEVEHLLEMRHHIMHSPINLLNLWVKLKNCRKHDISTIVIVLWFSLNFPITYFVSNFTSVSNRIGPLCFGDTTNLQGLLRTLKCRYLSMEQGSSFCMLRYPKSLYLLHATLLVSSKKLLMSRGAPSWFEIVWSYGVEAIDY